MAQEDEIAPKKKSKFKWIVLILLILLLGGGAGAAYKLGFLDQFIGAAPDTDETTTPAAPAAAVNTVPTAKLPTFLVNLYDPLGRRYIKLDLELELISPEVAKEVEMQNARIRDSLIMLLSSKSYTELSSQEGKHILRNEILDRLNQVLGGPKVVRVFFVDLVIQ